MIKTTPPKTFWKITFNSMDIVKSIVDLVDNVEIDLETLFSIGGLNRALWCFNEVLLSPNMKVSKGVP